MSPDQRTRAILRARSALAVARYFEDEQGEAAELARLRALGVDEAGDDLVPATGAEAGEAVPQ